MAYLHIFGYPIPMYGILFVTGVFVALMVALALSKYRELPKSDIIYSGIYVGIGAFIGSKLLFLIVSFKFIIENNIPLTAIIKGGYVFYGGLIGGFIGLYVYIREYKMTFSDFIDIYAVVLPLAHAFGRVGCFFSGCCYGIEYDGLFCYTYKYAIDNATPIGIQIFPVQLLEALLLVILFFILLIIFFKNRRRYTVTLTYFVIYPILRFSLEFLRGDAERGVLLGLSTSQWISMTMFIAAVVLAIKYRIALPLNHRKQLAL